MTIKKETTMKKLYMMIGLAALLFVAAPMTILFAQTAPDTTAADADEPLFTPEEKAWVDLAESSGFGPRLREIGRGAGGDGRRTMKALGIAVSRRYKAKIAAAVKAEVLKLVDGDTSKVTTHPYYQFRMKELEKQGGFEQQAADAFAAELMAMMDGNGHVGAGGGGQTIDLDQLKAEVAETVIKALEPTMNKAVDAKVAARLEAVYEKMHRGFRDTASLISGRNPDTEKKLSNEEKEKILFQLSTGGY